MAAQARVHLDKELRFAIVTPYRGKTEGRKKTKIEQGDERGLD